MKQSLATERGLNPRNRELVMEVLGRLAERVQSAEHSRNAVVNELVSLRERFMVCKAKIRVRALVADLRGHLTTYSPNHM